ncbi:MAG: hypothetical protein LBN43_01205 [Oscillospiraceae bacterium]|jgi:putative aldouronate transport system substrate-binding protein|nr:hypothetical protein [Oscillospiraceae bacterium]
MKRIITLLLALVFILALFAGCNNNTNNDTTGTTAPSATNSGGTTGNNDAGNSGGTSTEGEQSSPYNLAVNTDGTLKYGVDANGYPIEPYDYELPLTTAGDALTYWTTCWVPNDIPADADGQYGRTPYPEELKKRTGVNIEYVIAADAMTDFSVLMASQELEDIMSGVAWYYQEKPFREAVLSEGYWINIYDYKDYAPNYLYQVTKDPSDTEMFDRTFPEPGLILSFPMLWDSGEIQMNYMARGDWLDLYGKTAADIKTVDQYHDFLTWCKANTTDYPHYIYQTMDMAGTSIWTMYDTFAVVNGGAYVIDGAVQWTGVTSRDKQQAELFRTWNEEGLIDPEWESFVTNQEIDGGVFDTRYAFVQTTANGAMEHNAALFSQNANAETGWLPVTRPVLTEGQTLHLGGQASRFHYGSSCVAQSCENIELAVTWIDYKYSDEGAFLNTFGVEGISFEFNEKGEPSFTEFMYANPTGQNLTMLATLYCLNELSDAGMRSNMGRWAFPGSEAPDAYRVWADFKYDNAYTWPSSVQFSEYQQSQLNIYTGDVSTFLTENFIQFINGSKSMAEWDSFVETANTYGVTSILQIYQEAYDTWKRTH